MKIIISPKQGMCFGVKRALEIAEKASKEKGSRIFTYGPLVHNKEAVYALERKGISVVDSIKDMNKGDVVLIRTHGISDKEMEMIRSKGVGVIDATCPFVSKAKKEAKEMEKQGFRVVILGQKEHPEVKGISESLKSPFIIGSPDELNSIGKQRRVGLISQTTQSEGMFNETVQKLKRTGAELKISNTICNATAERQSSAIQTANDSDLMIVVGDKSSANTIKLAELCSEITETKQIESVSELEEYWFSGRSTVGITAGASTPDWVVEKVVEKIRQFGNRLGNGNL